MKRAVLFDLIGTLLVAESRHPLSSIYPVLADHGLRSTMDAFTAAWEAEKTIPSQIRHTPFEERIFRVADKLDWALDWKRVERIADTICDTAAAILSVDPEALNLLRKLKRIVKLGLVTNYDHPPAVHKMIAGAQLADFFDVVIISGELGIWKPDPGILLAAIDAMSLQPADCIYVGDSAVDIEVSFSAGVDPVLILRENDRIDPFRNPEKDLEKEHQEKISNRELRVIRKLSEVEGLM